MSDKCTNEDILAAFEGLPPLVKGLYVDNIWAARKASHDEVEEFLAAVNARVEQKIKEKANE